LVNVFKRISGVFPMVSRTLLKTSFIGNHQQITWLCGVQLGKYLLLFSPNHTVLNRYAEFKLTSGWRVK
jgi:hypothetical protein